MERYSNIYFADFYSEFLYLLSKELNQAIMVKSKLKTNESIFSDTEDKTDPLLHKIKNITIILAF